VCGPELLPAAAERGAREGWRFFFYGGAEGVADQLADRLKQAYPGLQVVGTYCPPFRPMTPSEDEAVVAVLNDAAPDIVWVGLSTPKQERWMADHVGRVQAPVMVGVGAAFDMHAGVVSRAPQWLRRTGFEWTYRLFREPRRLLGRYARNNPSFVLRLVRHPPRLVASSRSPGEPVDPA
jgi:N-acetylglucosaminyldiphosphoundecaprenol N-acetyl-beta-D-mannosaminyltransferase